MYLLVIYILGIVITYLMFSYFDILSTYHKPYKKLLRVFLYLVNGFFGIVIVYSGFTYPALILISISTVFILEYRLVSKDTHIFYFFLFFLIMFNLSTLYTIAFSISRLIVNTSIAVNDFSFNLLAFIIICLVYCVFMLVIIFSKKFPNETLSKILHSKNNAGFILVYMIICSVFQLLSLNFTIYDVLPVIDNQVIKIKLCIDIIFKTIAVFTFFYFLIFYIAKNSEISNINNKLSHNIQKELRFRKNLYGKALFNLCANLTNDTIEEGNELFVNKSNSKVMPFSFLANNIVNNYIHPDDKQIITKLINLTSSNAKQMDDLSQTVRFRVNTSSFYDLLTATMYEKLSKKVDYSKEWIWVQANVTIDLDPFDVLRLYVAYYNVDSIVNEEQALKNAAQLDPLTGLYNRNTFTNLVISSLDSGKRGSFFIIDIDNFKEINDTLGHPRGDSLLCHYASVFNSIFRENDIVGRIGGDEFCIYAPNLCEFDLAKERAMELIARGTIYNEFNNKVVTTSLSMGIVVCANAPISLNDLYEYADKALYSVKNSGKNGYYIYNLKTDKIVM